jgi:hypothetical protein
MHPTRRLATTLAVLGSETRGRECSEGKVLRAQPADATEKRSPVLRARCISTTPYCCWATGDVWDRSRGIRPVAAKRCAELNIVKTHQIGSAAAE